MKSDMSTRFGTKLQNLNKYPGWLGATPFLEGIAKSEGFKRIIDIGGGANPMLTSDFVRTNDIEYSLVDISKTELDKAPAHYSRKICVDLTAPTEKFLDRIDQGDFDMAFSHMFLEHIADPVQAHTNVRSLLRQGGLAIHFYPSANNLPLALNRLLPEFISTSLVKLAQPERDLSGHLGKFPAYYKLCGNPSPDLHRLFESLGFKVLVHTGFVGHRYYKRFPVLRQLERASREILIRAGIGLTSAQLLIMTKV